jgi:formylglycine-generating enzyme required for sulfatase activity
LNGQSQRVGHNPDGLSRRDLLGGLAAGCTLLALGSSLRSQTANAGGLLTTAEDGSPPPLIPPPPDVAQWPAWREALGQFRTTARARLKYSDALYRRQDFAWVPSCFTCCFLMVNDERFLNARTGQYQVDAFLEAEAEKFGGYDAVVLWQAYPRIGLDDRTQFDFYRDLPGGLPGVRDVVRRLHGHGVKAFLCYNPWDKGTRLGGEDHLPSLLQVVGALEADGIFLDTMEKAGREFREGLDGLRPGVALEGEAMLPLPNIHDHHLSWAQWWSEYDTEAPGVLRNKWFERRHMQHEIRRWDWDHTAELHTAWMNGSGMMVWENVFGQSVNWSERDRSILRAIIGLQRHFVSLFSGEDWIPLVPTEQPNIFATQWGQGDLRLWTLVNRADKPIEGPLLTVDSATGHRFYDLILAKEADTVGSGDRRTLRGRMADRGVGCFLATTAEAPPRGLESLLAHQRDVLSRHKDDPSFVRSAAHRVPVRRTTPFASPPAGMVRIPGASLALAVEFRVREVGFYQSWTERPITWPWLKEKITFTRQVSLTDFALEEAPVTNRQFAEFLQASGYRPPLGENFLKHWQAQSIPPGLEDHPVVYVSLEDARAYASWAGKRLPTEEEWQYAAQGPAGLEFPWGDQDDPARRNGGEKGGTTPVRAYPQGRSPFGAYDLCGNVWELTESEHTDGRNRFLVLKGGSFYRAEGSIWYFDGGPQPNRQAAKMLLFWPGLDRCATVGFRCAVDL